jgi:purine-binding chemotaxis protein CheW
VTGVVSLAPEQVSPVHGADDAQVDYLIGLGQTGTRRLILVDIDRLMSVRRPKQDGARQVA